MTCLSKNWIIFWGINLRHKWGLFRLIKHTNQLTPAGIEGTKQICFQTLFQRKLHKKGQKALWGNKLGQCHMLSLCSWRILEMKPGRLCLAHNFPKNILPWNTFSVTDIFMYGKHVFQHVVFEYMMILNRPVNWFSIYKEKKKYFCIYFTTLK